jgi:cell filamentation protein
MADYAGYPIDLHDLDADAFLNAMITSFDGDEEPLAAMIQGLIEDEADSCWLVRRARKQGALSP